MSTPQELPYRAVLHVHPTRRCNLACRHCYSTSGPGERAQLPVSTLIAAVQEAASIGYEVLSVSGGEPFLYAELPELLKAAKAAGMSTSVVTNGYLVGRRPYLAAARDIDTLALSLDGAPARHNWMRHDPKAFGALESALQTLKKDQRPFGLVMTVSHQSWEDIDWAVQYAEHRGARLLQLHPLEDTGRAAREVANSGLTPDQLVTLYVMGPLLEASSPTGMKVHVDAIHVDTLRSDPGAFYSTRVEPTRTGALPSPLIIEDDGTLVPYAYGMNRRYRLGSLTRTGLVAALTMSDANGTSDRILQLCECAREIALARPDSPVLNWHETLVAASHRSSAEEPSSSSVAGAA